MPDGVSHKPSNADVLSIMTARAPSDALKLRVHLAAHPLQRRARPLLPHRRPARSTISLAVRMSAASAPILSATTATARARAPCELLRSRTTAVALVGRLPAVSSSRVAAAASYELASDLQRLRVDLRSPPTSTLGRIGHRLTAEASARRDSRWWLAALARDGDLTSTVVESCPRKARTERANSSLAPDE